MPEKNIGHSPTSQTETPRPSGGDNELIAAFNEFLEGWQRRGSHLSDSSAMLDTHPELVEIARQTAVSALALPAPEIVRLAKDLGIPEPRRSPSQMKWPRNKLGAWKTSQLRTSIASTMVGRQLTQNLGGDPRRYDPFNRTESSTTTPEDVVRINALFAKARAYVQPRQDFLERLNPIEKINLFEDTVDLTAQAVRELQYRMPSPQSSLVNRLRKLLPR